MSFSILNVTPLSSKLFNSDDKENVKSCIEFGGIFCETKYFWLVRGSCLTVGCIKTGLVIGKWKFSTTSKEPIKINCVIEFPRENINIPFLIVGLKCNGEKGMICIFQFTCSKVLRAVELPNEVKKISIISRIGNKCLLPEVLSVLDGIIAVGTSYGGLFLLDMCLQEYENASSLYRVLKDEKDACQTMDLQLNDISLLESHKNLANLNDEHLAIYLNELGNSSKQIFNLRGPENTVLGQLSNQNISITALYYCSQLYSLFVGYNFGVWQIWNLKEMDVIYTSPVLDKSMPVTHFALQEPCDDPRAFCYIWVIYNNVEPFSLGFPLAVMYALLFDTKIWHDKCGFFYQGLFSCHVRFQRELALIENNGEKPLGGFCTGLSSISKSVSNLNSTHEFSEDGFSYCFFTWNTWTIDRKLKTYLTLFDLNQWYKEQMPSYLHKRDEHIDSYTITVSISDFLKSVNNKEDSTLYDVKVDHKSLVQFKGAVKLEEHYYSSSLSFNFLTLKEKEVILIKNRGCQQNLLHQITTQGPACLTNSLEFYNESIRIGLTPLFVEHENFYETNVDFQKEFLLNVALEQQLFCWLCKCAVISSDSFNSFLQWAWNRAQVLKQNAYDLCNYLFDSTGMSMDSNVCNTFSNCLKQLRLLVDLYNYILKDLSFLPSLEAVRKQLINLETTVAYLEIIKWSINVGLLPETPLISNPSHDRLNRQFVPYPIKDITTCFDKRRKLLKDVNNSDCNNSLFIDNLINSGRNFNVLKRKLKMKGPIEYPLPCLHNVLEIYLEDSLSLITKHQIFIYTLIDITEYLDEEGYEKVKKKLRMFSVVFKIPTTVTKMVEAFWHLDRGNFYEAVNQLLEPQIRVEDIEMWQHKILLKTLIIHNEYKLALLYFQIKKPPLLQENNLYLIISLYIANDMLDEAYHFQKSRRIEYGDTKLIRHFLRECISKNKILGLLHISLNVYEKKLFLEYLNEKQDPQLKNIKKLYFLQKYTYWHKQGKEIANCVEAEASPGIYSSVTVYPQIFDGTRKNIITESPQADQRLIVINSSHKKSTVVSSENISFTPRSILTKTTKNNSKKSLNTEQKRLTFSPNPSKNNTNESLDSMVQGSPEDYCSSRDNFDNNSLSIQISFTKNLSEVDANAGEFKNVTSEIKIDEKQFFSNEKEVLPKINDNNSNKDLESSFSIPKSISLNQRNETYDNFRILHPVSITENEFVPYEEETSNHRSYYLNQIVNSISNIETIEKPALGVQIIDRNSKESPEIPEYEIGHNINTLLENIENLKPRTTMEFSCSKSVNNEQICMKNNVNLEHNTKHVDENEIPFDPKKVTFEKLLGISDYNKDKLTENDCTINQNNKQAFLWNLLPTEQNQKHSRKNRNKKNENEKTVSLIRIKISPRKDHHHEYNKTILTEEKGATFKTNKNTVYQGEQRNKNKLLENSLEQYCNKESTYETPTQRRTNCSNSSFKGNFERLLTRFRLTPVKGKEKKNKKSAVSLIRLRVTPIKEIRRNSVLEAKELNKQINILFSDKLIKTNNKKITTSVCCENKVEIDESKPNSPIPDKSIDKSTNMLEAKDNAKRDLSKELDNIELNIDNLQYTSIYEQEENKVEIESKPNLPILKKSINKSTDMLTTEENKKIYLSKELSNVELNSEDLLQYASTHEQESLESLNTIPEYSQCLNMKLKSKEEEITTEHKIKEDVIVVNKNENVLHSQNFNKTNIQQLQSGDTCSLIDANSIPSNIIYEDHFNSGFQNEINCKGQQDYDHKHKSIRKQLINFENEKNDESQISFLEEVSVDLVPTLNRAIIDVGSQIWSHILTNKNTDNEKNVGANMTMNYNDDSDENSEEYFSGIEQEPDISSSSIQYVPNFDEIEAIEISDSKIEKKEKSTSVTLSLSVKSDFFNNAFINNDTNFTTGDNSQNRKEISESAEQNPNTTLSSIQYVPNSGKTKVIDINDSKSEKKEKSLTSSPIVKSEFLNNAFINNDTNSVAVEIMENREDDCIKFVYAWVTEKGVNTSFLYETEESSEEEYEPNRNDNRIEVFEKHEEHNTLKVKRYSQSVNTSKRKTSLLQKGISSLKDIESTHDA